MAGQNQSALIVDDKAFMADLQKAVKGLKLSTEQQLFEMANDTVNKAKTFAPVDTGALKASIQIILKGRDSKGAFVDIGVPEGVSNMKSRQLVSDYASYVEYGTSEQVAQPFLRPAIAWAVGARGTQYVSSWGVAV